MAVRRKNVGTLSPGNSFLGKNVLDACHIESSYNNSDSLRSVSEELLVIDMSDFSCKSHHDSLLTGGIKRVSGSHLHISHDQGSSLALSD